VRSFNQGGASAASIVYKSQGEDGAVHNGLSELLDQIKSEAGLARAVRMDEAGVRKRGCTFEKNRGRRPSRDIASQIRLCAKRSVKSTVVSPAIAPTATMPPAQRSPLCNNANETGDATSSRAADGAGPRARSRGDRAHWAAP